MYEDKLKRLDGGRWCIEPFGKMRVPVLIYADEKSIKDMDENVYRQAANVASLPGIVQASYAMPDAHWGYGCGVGFDISCGVRSLRTGITAADIEAVKDTLADLLVKHIPAGVGSTGKLKLSPKEMDQMLQGGARWAVEKGYGTEDDLTHTEQAGQMPGAEPKFVSDHAKQRQKNQVGTLGSGNHYLEVQKVTELYDAETAAAFGLALDEVVVSIHCGSRGLGHQIATDYLPRMVKAAQREGIELPERELACASITSDVGRQYFAAMNCGINCAVANRQVLTHLVRRVFAKILPRANLTLLYDVSHNTCKVEKHIVGEKTVDLYVHRKGATRAFGPGRPELPPVLRNAGQPVLVGGTMGTASYILVGTKENMSLSFGSCCHGAGRAMSRRQATKTWQGADIVRKLADRNIIIRSASLRGVAEEAPGAYKDVTVVVDATEKANLARKVARLEPVICVKG